MKQLVLAAWPALLFVVLTVLLRQWLPIVHAPGLCDQCKYNLTGNVSGVGPECGAPEITSAMIVEPFNARHFL